MEDKKIDLAKLDGEGTLQQGLRYQKEQMGAPMSREILETRLTQVPEAARQLMDALRGQAEPGRQEQLAEVETREEMRRTVKSAPYTVADEVFILREQRDRADQAAMLAQRQHNFKHKEAFMLMTYVSEGGHYKKLIWNSRDGVTPFSIGIDGLKYTHDIPAMTGPFFDRPGECDAQWETRTMRGMMAAWERSLSRAVLSGRMPKEKAEHFRTDAEMAKSWNLHLGLRSLETGKFTDEA